MREDTLEERALASYLGFAVGDALGAPVEFMTAREIAARHGRLDRMVGGGWLKLAPGQVTDDTQMALALGEAILDRPEWDLARVAEGFAAWLRTRPVDVGNTCRRGIQRYLLDGSLVGAPHDGDAGNGAVMRNLPVVLSTLHDEAAFVARSLAQARFTHHHPLSDAATLGLGRMARALLLGHGMAACEDIAATLVAAHPAFRHDRPPRHSSAYVVDTVQTVLHHFFREGSFEECLVAIVNRGEDADTNAALAGMLAGARDGLQAVPQRWLAKLDANVRSAIERQVDALLHRGQTTRGPEVVRHQDGAISGLTPM